MNIIKLNLELGVGDFLDNEIANFGSVPYLA